MTLKPEHIVEALNKKTFDEIDPDEVLKHYGYKPEEVRCNGVGIGVWRKEEAFQKLGDIGAFMRFTYSNQKKKVNIKVTIGTADRMLKLNQYASSEADAKRQLQAAIDNKNHSATTISFTTMGNLTYCATQCIDVEGYGKIDGKYYMDSVGHTMNKSGGFVTKVSASRVGG